MKKDLLKILKKIISGIAGSEAEKIVDLLYNKKNVNEFRIAKKLNLNINQTRNILYKLADNGLVTFVRKKDKKKGGWYIYFWTLETEKSLSKFRNNIENKINKLKEEISNREKERFYHCPNCEIEYDEESALLNDFTCPECGEILLIKESKQIISQLNNEVRKLEKILEQLNEEIQKIQKKEKKIKEKRLLEEKKQKEIERKKRLLARKKEKEKEKKKTKKIVKKTKKKAKKSKPKSKKSSSKKSPKKKR